MRRTHTVKRKIPRPTPAELEILRVLWKQGPSTVREVQTELSRSRQTGYTTALKFLQIMTEKGLVRRNESQRTHIYQARLRKEETQRHLVSDLLERAFEGSAARLATHALSAHKVSPEEVQEIRRLLDELEGSAARPAAHALSTHKVSPEEVQEIQRLLDELEGGPDERS